MSARIGVIQVIPQLEAAGAEWLVCNLATALDRSRFDVTVASLYSARNSVVEKKLTSAGIRVEFLGKKPGLDVAMFWKIDRLLTVLRPQVLHSHLGVLQYALPAMIRRPWLKVVHTVHNLAEHELIAPARIVQRLAFRSGVQAVTIARAVDDSFKRLYGRSAVAMIPNGIPVERYSGAAWRRVSWRERECIGEEELVAICVARIWPQKGIDNLLRAFAMALPTGKAPSLLLLVGDGPQRGEMEALAAELGIVEHVRFLGARSDVADALAASDMFLLASRFEGNPLSVMEAMSASLPVVATAVGGVPELVQSGQTGLLVPPDDVDALARAISTVSANDGLRIGMGQAGKLRALEAFDASVMARQYADLYERLVHPQLA